MFHKITINLFDSSSIVKSSEIITQKEKVTRRSFHVIDNLANWPFRWCLTEWKASEWLKSRSRWDGAKGLEERKRVVSGTIEVHHREFVRTSKERSLRGLHTNGPGHVPGRCKPKKLFWTTPFIFSSFFAYLETAPQDPLYSSIRSNWRRARGKKLDK